MGCQTKIHSIVYISANGILTGLDTSVNPCDNFYQYACGGWTSKTVIPEYRASYSRFTELDDAMSVQLKGMTFYTAQNVFCDFSAYSTNSVWFPFK